MQNETNMVLEIAPVDNATAAGAAEEVECPICCEKYNNSTRKIAKCEYASCMNTLCKACLRACLMSTPTDAHCFQCKNPFTDKYLVNSVGRTWITTDYRIHRREMLFQREGIAKLPDSMNAAIMKKKLKKEEDCIRQYRIQINALKEKERELAASINSCYTNISTIRRGGSGAAAAAKEEAAVFIMNCTADGCRGYLSSAYKCGLCELYTCAKCFELVGHTRNDASHICKEENVQSADLIRKDTKPCPSCGTRTHKIEGCNQMFCTNCKKAWSWNTGKIDESGRIHNPHYYEWQRELAEKQGTTMAREPGDIVCGGLCTYQEMRSRIFCKLMNLLTNELRSEISEMHRTVSHITNVDVESTRTKVRQLGNYEELRVSYINGDIMKEEMAISIYRNDNSRKKYTEYLHVYELLSVVGVDLFRALVNSAKEKEAFLLEVEEKVSEYRKMREYSNEVFGNISRTYSQTVPYIDDKWTIKSKKYTISKRIKKKAEAEEGEEATIIVV
jgi:hypothetical protein